VHRLRHGYTNRTVGDGTSVRKTYTGHDAEQRLGQELAALTRLRDVVPLPPVRGVTGLTLELGFVSGDHGQDLLAAGQGALVLGACGKVLRRIHDVSREGGRVLVHGDFGPNNVLLAGSAVVAVLDWEFAHLGDPVEDLAWCEWLVRTHHPEQEGALAEFFSAYGSPVPEWPERHKAMLTRCHELADFCTYADPSGAGAALWHDRALATAEWRATHVNL
jgi:Ser/Thr protein kinase RdoA (MazF antagonist)